MKLVDNFTFLIIEDDDIDLMTIQRALAKAEVTNPIFYARNGLEGLNLLKSGKINKPMIILLDLNMPKMNGFEFLQIIRNDERWKLIPVIALTTSNMDSDKLKAYSLNVAGYIVKPVEFSDFIDTINSIEKYWSINQLPV
jgi:CheY-like chemotaxis protein